MASKVVNRKTTKAGGKYQENSNARGKENDKGLDSKSKSGILALDVKLSKSLAVCARDDSSLGFLRPLMKLLEYSCHGIPWLIGNVGVLLVSHTPAVLENGVNLFFGLILDLVIVGVIKTIVRRRRPAENQDDMFGTVSVDKFSFPSGHTTRAAMLACFMLERLTLGTMRNSAIVVWASSVALSRVMLGRHHVLDVGAGVVIGTMTYQLLSYLWISQTTALNIMQPIQEELHL